MTGAGGMLGRDLVFTLAASGQAVEGLARRDLDITSAAACRAAVRAGDVVVNCAAWTDVDGAESQEAEAFAVNAVGAANLARACEHRGAALVQLSTDYVFSGTGDQPHRVDEPLAPLNAYGRTKAAAEWAVRAECASAYVVRTAWLYGEHGPNFVTTMIRIAGERDFVEVVDDQRGQPTWTRDLSAFVLKLVTSDAPFGTYHGTATGSTTWFGLAREVFARTGLDPGRVRPTSSERFPRPAARPRNSVLLTGDHALPDWRDSLRRFLARAPAPLG